MDSWKAWWSHCHLSHRGNSWNPCCVIMSLADTSLKAGWRLGERAPHSESKLYKTRHMISKYHQKLLKKKNNNNNTVDWGILKHLASLPPSLLHSFSPLLSPFPHSSLFPSLSPSCALVTLVNLLCWRVSVVFAKCCTCIIIKPLD